MEGYKRVKGGKTVSLKDVLESVNITKEKQGHKKEKQSEVTVEFDENNHYVALTPDAKIPTFGDFKKVKFKRSFDGNFLYVGYDRKRRA